MRRDFCLFLIQSGMPLLLIGYCAPTAMAHRLRASYQVLPGCRILVRGTFDHGGGHPLHGHVVAKSSSGEIIDQSSLRSHGTTVLSFRKLQSIWITITDTTGHRAEARASVEDLRGTYQNALSGTVALCLSPQTTPLVRMALLSHFPGAPEEAPLPGAKEEESGSLLKNILIGIGFLLALASFLMCLRNARELERLRKAIEGKEGSD